MVINKHFFVLKEQFGVDVVYYVSMEGLAQWLSSFFEPIVLPDISDWHEYPPCELEARYRTVKLRDPITSRWKTHFIYRWPNYRGQGYDASLIRHCPSKYMDELLTLTIGEYNIPRVSDGLIYYMAQHDLNWINEAHRRDNALLNRVDTWNEMQK